LSLSSILMSLHIARIFLNEIRGSGLALSHFRMRLRLRGFKTILVCVLRAKICSIRCQKRAGLPQKTAQILATVCYLLSGKFNYNPNYGMRQFGDLLLENCLRCSPKTQEIPVTFRLISSPSYATRPGDSMREGM